MTTFIRWLKFLLRVLGLYQEEIVKPGQAEVAEQVQEIETHENQIDAQAQADTDAVAGMSESELDQQLRR